MLIVALPLWVIAEGAQGPVQAAFPGANGKIAFMSERDGSPEIYTMNSDGSGQARLTRNAAADTSPAWSPMARGSPS